MNPQLTIIISNLISGCLVALVIWLLGRKKSKTEIQLNSTAAQLNNTAAYSSLLHDLENKLNAQAKQITQLEEKLKIYTEMILNYQNRESEFLARIYTLETENKKLTTQINARTKRNSI